MMRRSNAPRRRHVGMIGVVAMLLTLILPVGAVSAAPSQTACDTRTNNTIEKLVECVRVDGVRAHQAALQAVADANGGTRAAGTAGYADSVAYVVDTLEAAGWNVELDEFPFTYTPLGELQQLAPVTASYVTGSFSGTGFGQVTGVVIPVDLALAPPQASSSGCEASDFAGLDFSGPNDIALIQRGTCFFSEKAVNAEAAGAEAIIIFNQGNTPDRSGPLSGNATALPDGSPSNIGVPVVGASFDAGVALAQPGSTAYVSIDPPEERPQVNVIAELPGANDDNVVMAGAHLDSVPQGPGIQDNGSGSATLLEIAEQIAKLKPQNTLRFAWWGAEESGLIGSTAYVNGLGGEELDRIALYLNFDMIGSPNHIFMAYDADESGFAAPVPVPDGSIAIEDLFESYYTKVGEPYDDAAFSGRSDYQAFINSGIPAGGLFTGAEGIKTADQAAIWGGTAGDQYDPCYHLACDTYDNISLHALDVNSDAVAVAVLTYAYSTETVNGVKGKKVPGKYTLPEPAGPEGTTGSSGGADFHDHAS